MAIGFRVTPDTYRRAAGAATLAVATDLADLRAPRLLPQVENGQLLEGAALVAKAFNVGDGTHWGDVVDGLADGAVAFLTRDLSSSRLNPLLNGGGGVIHAAAVTPAAAPAGAAGANSTQVASSVSAADAATQAAY